MSEKKKEVWRVIQGFPGYMINQSGDVRTTGGQLISSVEDGPLAVNLRKDGKTYHRAIRKLLLAAFMDLP